MIPDSRADLALTTPGSVCLFVLLYVCLVPMYVYVYPFYCLILFVSMSARVSVNSCLFVCLSVFLFQLQNITFRFSGICFVNFQKTMAQGS